MADVAIAYRPDYIVAVDDVDFARAGARGEACQTAAGAFLHVSGGAVDPCQQGVDVGVDREQAGQVGVAQEFAFQRRDVKVELARGQVVNAGELVALAPCADSEENQRAQRQQGQAEQPGVRERPLEGSAGQKNGRFQASCPEKRAHSLP